MAQMLDLPVRTEQEPGGYRVEIPVTLESIKQINTGDIDDDLEKAQRDIAILLTKEPISTPQEAIDLAFVYAGFWEPTVTRNGEYLSNLNDYDRAKEVGLQIEQVIFPTFVSRSKTARETGDFAGITAWTAEVLPCIGVEAVDLKVIFTQMYEALKNNPNLESPLEPQVESQESFYVAPGVDRHKIRAKLRYIRRKMPRVA